MDDMTRTPMPLVVILCGQVQIDLSFLIYLLIFGEIAVWVSHRFNKATLKLTDDSEVHFHPDYPSNNGKVEWICKKCRNPDESNLHFTLYDVYETFFRSKILFILYHV